MYEKEQGGNDTKGLFTRASLLEVYQNIVYFVMHSPANANVELARDGDAELFEMVLAEDKEHKLVLSDLALTDTLKDDGNTLSLRPFMFNMQRDMTEKVARYMDAIILYYDNERKCTFFETKAYCYDYTNRREWKESEVKIATTG